MTQGPAPSSTESELRALLSLAWPIATSQFALVLLGIVDVAILGHQSVLDLAGSSIGRSIGFVAVGLSMGIGQALEPLASQAIGAGDDDRARSALRSGLWGCLVAWAPCMALAVASTFLLGRFGIEPEVVRRARVFLLAQAPGQLFFALFIALKCYLQARERTKDLLIAAIVSNVVNYVLCMLLVRGDAALVAAHLPPLGLRPLGALGAGLASSGASLSLCLTVLPAVRKFSRRNPDRNSRTIKPVTLGEVLRIGVPGGMQLVAEIGVFSAVALVAGRLGAVVVSAHQVAISVASFSFMGVLGISGATAVRVGRAVGAGGNARLPGLLGIGVGTAYMTLSAVFLALFPELLVGAFTKDPGVIATGVALLRIAAVFQIFDGIQGVGAGALRGAGDVRFAFVANVVGHWALGMPLALLCAYPMHLGAKGLWYGLTLGLAAVAVALLARFVHITRNRVRRLDA
jgi:MATE family multidrug resistance protein